MPPVPNPTAGFPTPWPATARYDLDHAPDGLGFVQDLLNTVGAGVPRQPDLLEDLTSATRWAHDAAARWSAVTGRPVDEIVLDLDGLRELRTFRDQLGQEIDARIHAGSDPGRPGAGTADRIPTAPRTTGATLRLDEHGSVRLEPAGTGADLLISVALAALFEAQLGDVRRRLKTCRNPRCRVAFYDRSRNNSGVWHSVRVCGYPTNLRAHRARRRQGFGDDDRLGPADVR
ncbi:CGNR zinc finger domain-containing protein [Plantactinospora sonchi]|uniref:CGNR zinc finger domain-containing protein n=1 Tax=Plantactinospora sonchi TaxID=1544735 RepID=A0ABU7RR64_9ACTN